MPPKNRLTLTDLVGAMSHRRYPRHCRPRRHSGPGQNHRQTLRNEGASIAVGNLEATSCVTDQASSSPWWAVLKTPRHGRSKSKAGIQTVLDNSSSTAIRRTLYSGP